MIYRMAVWNQVRQGSKIQWRGASGVLYDAVVVNFVRPESNIGIEDADGQRIEIWIESIEAVDNSELEKTEMPLMHDDDQVDQYVCPDCGAADCDGDCEDLHDFWEDSYEDDDDDDDDYWEDDEDELY